MTTLAKLVVKLIADVSEFSSGLDQAAKKAGEIGKTMQAVGDKMTVGVTLPLVAAGTAAVKFASDLEETRNKTRVVFGRMGEDMLKFGAQASRTMGMSENAALSYAATYGSILTNMGIAEEEAAKMSQALTQLTADYASFHNLNPGEAFEKIKAGLVGSSEPLISLGKDLRQASVQAFALENGIARAGEQMTPAQLAMARFGSLIAQSSKEMGDFARTSDGLANSARTLKASMEDTMASFGEALLPVITEFMQALIPILRWFNELPKPVKTGIVYFLMFAAALGPVLGVAGRAIQVFSALSSGLGTAGVAGGAAKAAGALAGAAKAAGGLAAGIGAVLGPALALAAAIAALILVIKTMGPQALESARMLVIIFGKMLTDAYFAVLRFRMQMMDAGKQLMIGFINGVLSFAAQLIEAVIKPVQKAVEAVRKMLKISSPSRVMEWIGEMMVAGFASGIETGRAQPAQAMQSVPLIPAAAQIGGGARMVQIGEIRVYGDLSDSQMRRMKEEMRRIAETVFVDALR